VFFRRPGQNPRTDRDGESLCGKIEDCLALDAQYGNGGHSLQIYQSERTANWDLHLQAMHDMLPYFAASGHNSYTKSAYLYLQMMQALPDENPEVYTRFQNGLHPVRRGDRYWASLSTVLVMEQVLEDQWWPYMAEQNDGNTASGMAHVYANMCRH